MKDEEDLPQRPRCVELLYLSLFNCNVYVQGSREGKGKEIDGRKVQGQIGEDKRILYQELATNGSIWNL